MLFFSAQTWTSTMDEGDRKDNKNEKQNETKVNNNKKEWEITKDQYSVNLRRNQVLEHPALLKFANTCR